LPVLRKLEDRLRDGKARLPRRHRGQPLAVADGIGQVGAVRFRELGLVIEQIELRRGTALKHVDDPLGLRRKMRQPRETAGRQRVFVRGLRQHVELEQLRERSGADAEASLPEKTTSGRIERIVDAPIHDYSFITVSCRLRIRLVTLVYAASSVTSKLASRGYSPTLTYFRAASGFDVNRSWFCRNASRRIAASAGVGRRAVARRKA